LAGRFALNEKEAAIYIINEARHLLKVRTNCNIKKYRDLFDEVGPNFGLVTSFKGVLIFIILN